MEFSCISPLVTPREHKCFLHFSLQERGGFPAAFLYFSLPLSRWDLGLFTPQTAALWGHRSLPAMKVWGFKNPRGLLAADLNVEMWGEGVQISSGISLSIVLLIGFPALLSFLKKSNFFFFFNAGSFSLLSLFFFFSCCSRWREVVVFETPHCSQCLQFRVLW